MSSFERPYTGPLSAVWSKRRERWAVFTAAKKQAETFFFTAREAVEIVVDFPSESFYFRRFKGGSHAERIFSGSAAHVRACVARIKAKGIY